MKALAWALLAGLIFGVGLCISGMTNPENVIGFLDVTGNWSPNLAGVMMGAIAVHAAWLRWGARTGTALTRLPGSYTAPRAPRARLDGSLVGGAALFGIGWGLSGYCPGPGLVALGSGGRKPFVFVAAMVVGILLRQLRSRAPVTTTVEARAVAETSAAGDCGE